MCQAGRVQVVAAVAGRGYLGITAQEGMFAQW